MLHVNSELYKHFDNLWSTKAELTAGKGDTRKRDPSRTDRLAIDVIYMFRTEQQNHSLQVALTEYLIQFIIYVKCVDPEYD